MVWFWYFIIYSFLGCLLEIIFALISRHQLESRKCHFLLPLCPVYGAGAVAVIFLTSPISHAPWFIFLSGAVICTIVEYLTSLFYEKVLYVEFWSYQGSKFNIAGRVCLSFSAAWGLISMALIYFIHPQVSSFVALIPSSISIIMLAVFIVDLAISVIRLRKAKDKSCLALFSPISLKSINQKSRQ